MIIHKTRAQVKHLRTRVEEAEHRERRALARLATAEQEIGVLQEQVELILGILEGVYETGKNLAEAQDTTNKVLRLLWADVREVGQ